MKQLLGATDMDTDSSKINVIREHLPIDLTAGQHQI